MRIGIDARLYGVKHTGIGRYVQNLVIELGKIDHQNEYYIFGDEDIITDINSYPNFHFVKLTTRVYSLAEQAVNPLVFQKYHLDILHVPHFNAPLLYRGKIVITVHDLIKHLSTGKETTTLPLWQYSIKKVGYKAVVASNLAKAQSVITPSAYWRDYLLEHYQLKPDQVHVTYEAVGSNVFSNKRKKEDINVVEKFQLTKPFVIYTGNLYPHKNVEFLVRSIIQFNLTHKHQLQLAIICARDLFAGKIKTDESIKYLGYVSDEQMVALYHEALALVQPSLIEGFGLTGLEAMTAGLPVLSSNATCLPEVYADAALYFDPRDESELIEKLNLLYTDKEQIERLVVEGKKRIKDFSWAKMARQTLDIYKRSV